MVANTIAYLATIKWKIFLLFTYESNCGYLRVFWCFKKIKKIWKNEIML